jgi:hypothetical protein
VLSFKLEVALIATKSGQVRRLHSLGVFVFQNLVLLYFRVPELRVRRVLKLLAARTLLPVDVVPKVSIL